MNYVDRKMFVLFCVSIWVFALANLLGTVYLCYRADCPVGLSSQENFDLRAAIESQVRSKRENPYMLPLSDFNVEWSMEGNKASCRGSYVRDGGREHFCGELVKFNTGWKLVSFRKEQGKDE